MSSPSQRPAEDKGQVLRFRARAPQPARADHTSDPAPEHSPVADIGKYARRSEEPDDYRHRMKMNAITAALLVALIGCGLWLVDTMAQIRRNQDCVLSGQRNCAPINVPSTGR